MGRNVAAGIVVDIFQPQSKEDLLMYQLWSVSKRNTSRKNLYQKKKIIWLHWFLVAACKILFHKQGSNPGPLYWKNRVLATGPPGKSQGRILNWLWPEHWKNENCSRSGAIRPIVMLDDKWWKKSHPQAFSSCWTRSPSWNTSSWSMSLFVQESWY